MIRRIRQSDAHEPREPGESRRYDHASTTAYRRRSSETLRGRLRHSDQHRHDDQHAVVVARGARRVAGRHCPHRHPAHTGGVLAVGNGRPRAQPAARPRHRLRDVRDGRPGRNDHVPGRLRPLQPEPRSGRATRRNNSRLDPGVGLDLAAPRAAHSVLPLLSRWDASEWPLATRGVLRPGRNRDSDPGTRVYERSLR